MTEAAPTLQAQLDELPTQIANAKDSFTDFSAAPEIVLDKILERNRSLKSYREEVETYKDNQLAATINLEVVNPDKIHGYINSQETKTEVIMISQDFYIKVNDSWMKVDLPMDLQQYVVSFEKYQQNMTDIKMLGPDNLDGRPTMVVQFSYNTNDSQNTTKVWVGLMDGYIYKMETESVINGENYLSTVVLSDFNADIHIEAPIQ